MRNSSASMTRMTLRPVGHLDAGQLLHGQHVGEVVHHAAQVVDAVGVGDVGVPGLALAHLLGAAMVEADVAAPASTISSPSSCSDDAQHAVRAGVLRAEVEEHEVEVLAALRCRPQSSGRNCKLLLLAALPLGRACRTGSISVARAGCSLRSGWPSHQGGIRMRRRCGWPSNADAEHVPHLALVPVGGRPEVGDGRHGRVLALQRDLDPHVVVALEREQVVDDGEVARRAGRARCARSRSSMAVRS